MPVLEITHKDIGPRRTNLVLSYIGGMMLWPDDLARRNEAMKASTAAYLAAVYENMPAPARRAVDAEELLDLHHLLRAALPEEHLWKKVQQPWADGIMAGELLYKAVAAYARDGAVSLKSLKLVIVDSKRRAGMRADPSGLGHLYDVGLATLDIRIWGRLRPVAHLWAAYFRALEAGDDVFPCRLDRLPEFLGLARYFAVVATWISAKNSDGPLLPPDQLWAIPGELELPGCSIEAGGVALMPSGLRYRRICSGCGRTLYRPV